MQELREGKKLLASDTLTMNSYIQKHLGISNSEVYKLTALIEQSDLAAVGNGGKSLQESIQESLTGSENVSVNEILKRLKERVADYMKGLDPSHPAKTPGAIKVLTDEEKALELKLEDIRAYLSKYSTSTVDEQESSKELKMTEKRITEFENVLKLNELREKSERRLEEITKLIQEKEVQIRDIIRFQEQEKEKANELKTMNRGQDWPKMKDHINTINTLLKEKKANIDTLKVDGERKVSARPAIPMRFLVLSVVIGIAVFAFGVLLNLQILLILLAALVLALMPVLYVLFVNGSVATNSAFESQIDKLNNEISDLNRKREAIFDESDTASEREFMAVFEKINSLEKDFEKVRASLDSLTKQKHRGEIEREQAELLSEKKELEGNLTDEIKASRLSAGEKVKIQKQLDKLKGNLRDLLEKQSMAKAIIETSEYSYDDLVETEEKLESIQSDLEYAKNKAKTLAYVSKYITIARDDVIASSGKIIAKHVQELLPILTNGRYSRVKIDPGLNFQIYSEEKKDWVKPDDYLSSGTIDQIYFVARIAILSLICKDKKPPIILDDPFVTFDEERKDGVLKILNKLSKEFQIILLTCHEDYNSWGNLIKL